MAAVAADSLILRKSSGLIAIDGAMSAIQHRAFNVLLHVAASSYRNNSPTGQLFRVPMKYLREKSGYTGGGNKDRFLKEIIELADIVVSGNLLNKAPEKRGKKEGKNGNSWRKFALVSEFRLSDNRRELLWAFPPTIMDEIVRPAVFGKIDLTAMFGLKPAALVIYELARDYVNVQIPKLDMAMLRRLTGYVNKYEHDSDFIKEVIEPAAFEAGSRMGMLIATERLHGNMVRFLMTPKKGYLEMAEKVKELSYDDLIDMIPAEACNDVLKTTVWRHVTESGADYVFAQIEYIRNQTGIRCFAASLTSALKGDYAGFVKTKASKEKIAKEAARRERRQRRSASSAEAQAAKAELRAERAQKKAEIAQKAAEMAREKANSAAQKVQASPAIPVMPTEPTATHELNQVEEVDDDPFSLDRIDNLYSHPHSVEYSDNLDDVPF